jgi:hypothetical protein
MLKYPAIIDDNTVLPIVVDGATPIKAKTLNDLRDAVIRIEKELGIKPSRIYTNVKTRLDEIDKIIARMSGGDILRIIGTPKKGQTIIWNGRNWVPDTNFLAENLTTTGNFKVGRAKSTSAHAGLINISGKFILNKIPTPATSDPGDGTIFFDGSQFMVSEDGRPYVPLNVGSGMTVPASFFANGDLQGNNLTQTVIGLRDRKVDIVTNAPKEKEALIFNSSSNTWITGTDFGANVISTAGDFKAKNITISDFAVSTGILHWQSTPPTRIYSKLIFDADVHPGAAIRGTKINPEFGNQNILTQKSISANTAYSPKIHLGSTSSPTLVSIPGTTLPATANQGDVHFGKDGYVHMYKSGAWSLLEIDPSGPAYGDLSGSYPAPSVTGMGGIPVSSPPSSLPDGYVLSSSATNFSFSSVNFSKPNAVSGILPNSKQEPQNLSGDLSGTTSASKVVKILNREISDIAPEDGYFLAWNSSSNKFVPTPRSTLASSLPMSGSAGGDLSTNYPGPKVSKIQGLSIKDPSTLKPGNTFQVIGSDPFEPDYLGFNSIDLSDENIEGILPESKQDDQPMVGDVIGSTGSATVVKIDGMLLDVAAPSDGYCLVYDTSGTTPSWKPKSIATGGNPNTSLNGLGDLGGSYPNPSVIKINGASVPVMPATALDGYFLKVKNSTASPPSLEYGPLDLSGSLFHGVLPSSLQDPLSLSGDANGTTSVSSVSKIQNVEVQNFGTEIPLPSGELMMYEAPTSGTPKFSFSKPKLNELDGYAIISGASSTPSGEAGKGKIYYDTSVTPNKLKAIEGVTTAQDIIKSTSTRNLKVESLSATSLLSKITRHTATALPGGKILILGGHDGSNYLDTGYLYDPETGDLELLGSRMIGGKRADHTATLTKNSYDEDIVVIIGGYYSDDSRSFVSAVEYYDVSSNSFINDTATAVPSGVGASLYVGSARHTATLLKNNKILICGGLDYSYTSTATPYSYLYTVGEGVIGFKSKISYNDIKTNTTDPPTKYFDCLLNVARKYHTSTLIDKPGDPMDGYVLIAGGLSGSNKVINSSEIYDPATNFFYSYIQPQKYDGCASVTLSDGSVLFTGGVDDSSEAQKNCYIFDPKTNITRKACPLNYSRANHTITLLNESEDRYCFVIVGGTTSESDSNINDSGFIKKCEYYLVYKNDPEFKTECRLMYTSWYPSALQTDIKVVRRNHTATRFTKDGDDYILICGGFTKSALWLPPKITETAEIYLLGEFYRTSSNMLYPRANHTATLVDGAIMICGGESYYNIYNKYTTSISVTINTVADAKSNTSGSPTLRSGKSTISSVEYFSIKDFDNYNFGKFGSHTIPLPIDYESIESASKRSNFQRLNSYSCVHIGNDNVFICGGQITKASVSSGSLVTATSEQSKYSFIFNSKTKLFYRVADMLFGVSGHSLALLPYGNIISIGGGLKETQIYNPTSNAWTRGNDTIDVFSSPNLVTIPTYIDAAGATSAILVVGSKAVNIYYLGGINDGKFAKIEDLSITRSSPKTATHIPSINKVLIVGGNISDDTQELYDYSGNGSTSTISSTGIKLRGHSAISDGNRVVIAGGHDASGPSKKVFLFDYSSNSFTPKTDLQEPKPSGHAAVKLPDNKILFLNIEKDTSTSETPQISSELYDISSGSTAPTKQPLQKNITSSWFAFLSSSDSSVVDFIPYQTNVYTNEPADIPAISYNTLSKTASIIGGNLNKRRSHHIAIPLRNGNVMFIGGFSNTNNDGGMYVPLITNPPNYYDPPGVENLNYAPYYSSLASGSTNSVGTIEKYITFVASSHSKEIYDKNTKKLTEVTYSGDSGAVIGCSASEIIFPGNSLDGRVILSGGQNILPVNSSSSTNLTTVINRYGNFTFYATILSYNSSYSTIYNLSAYQPYAPYAYSQILSTFNKIKTDTVYSDGFFYVLGGYNPSILTSEAAKLYGYTQINPSNPTTLGKYISNIHKFNCATTEWSTPGVMRQSRYLHADTTLPNGNVLLTGGYDSTSSSPSLQSAEVFNTLNSAFENIKPMSSRRARHSAVKLSSGRTLVIGGNANNEASPTGIKSSEIYGGGSGSAPPADSNTYINWKFDDPSWTGSSAPSSNFTKNEGTSGSAANLTPHTQLSSSSATSDSIYSITALSTSSNALSNALYSDIGRSFDVPIMGAVTIEIGDGKILILDGATTNAYIFDGKSGDVTKTSNNMLSARNAFATSVSGRYVYEKNRFTATLFTGLNNKSKVLIVGGIDSYGNSIATAETFDVTSFTFDRTPISLTYGLMGHAATLLDSGDVLLSGGITKSVNTTTFRGASIFKKSTNSFVSYETNLTTAAHLINCSFTGNSTSDNPSAVPFSNSGSGQVTAGPLSLPSTPPDLSMYANSVDTTKITRAADPSSPTSIILSLPHNNSTGIWCRSKDAMPILHMSNKSFEISIDVYSTSPNHSGNGMTIRNIFSIGRPNGVEALSVTEVSQISNSVKVKSLYFKTFNYQYGSAVELKLMPSTWTNISVKYDGLSFAIAATATNSAYSANITNSTIIASEPTWSFDWSDGYVFVGGFPGKRSFRGYIKNLEIKSSSNYMEMQEKRYNHTATKLPNGNVFIVGGDVAGTKRVTNSCEIFDNSSNKFTPQYPITSAAGVNYPITNHSASLINNYLYLIGGQTLSGTTKVNSQNIFESSVSSLYFSQAPSLITSSLPGNMSFPASAVDIPTPPSTDKKLIVVHGHTGTSTGSQVSIVRGISNSLGSWTSSSSPSVIDGKSTYNICARPSVHVIRGSGYKYDGYAAVFDTGSINPGSNCIELYKLDTNEHLAINQPSNKNVTVSLWIKFNAFPNNDGYIICKNVNHEQNLYYMSLAPGGISIKVNSSGKIILETSINRSYATIVSNTAVVIGRWYHIAATYDGVSVNRSMSLYINASLENQLTSASSPSLPAGALDWGVGNFYIGGLRQSSATTVANSINALIDDVRIENVTKTASEIQSLYSNGISNVWVPTGDLITSRYGHTASLIKNATVTPDKVSVIGGSQNASTQILNIEKYDDSTKQYTQMARRVVISKNYTALPTDSNIVFLDAPPASPKTITVNLTLPDSSACPDGKLITASISPYLVSSHYTINVFASSSSSSDAILISTFNKSSVTLILNKSSSTPTWIPVDNAS